jgi:glucose-1-phosphate thymidylyltransferase
MEITDAISLLIDSGYRVVPHHVEGWWKDTGKPECVLEVNSLTLDSDRDLSNGKVDGGPTILNGTSVGSTLRQPVHFPSSVLSRSSHCFGNQEDTFILVRCLCICLS